MRVKRTNKYTGLITTNRVSLENAEIPLRVVFRLKADRQQIIDLTFLTRGPNAQPQMARVFAWYFSQELQHVARDSRRAALYSIYNFKKFLDWKSKGTERISSTLDISTATLLEYQMWLDTLNSYATRTALNHYSHISTIFAYLSVNKPELLSTDFKVPKNKFRFVKDQPSSVRTISIKTLIAINDAAVKEVKEIRKNHALAKRLLLEGEEYGPHSCNKEYWKSEANVLSFLVNQIGINSYPEKPQLHQLYENGYRAIKILNKYAPVFDRCLVPFLVLLFSKTLINVESIFRLKRNCLREHALPAGLTILDFDKPRSGSARKKSIPFPSNQNGGVVDLINFILEYTSPWVPFAREEEKESLFLFRASGEIRSPGENFAKWGLKLFIKENNLPPFNFAQLRPTLATLIYLQTRDVFRVQRLLCHTKVSTTISYIRQEVTRWQHDLEMNRGISSIVERFTNAETPLGKPTIFTNPINAALKEKIRGGEVSPKQAELIKRGGCSTGLARCKNPWDSPIPGERKGSLCKQIHMCIFCPNAWVFEEDLPKVIFYRDSLLADRLKLTETVWDDLHGEAFREITQEILPSYSKSLIEQATLKAKHIFKPYPLVEAH